MLGRRNPQVERRKRFVKKALGLTKASRMKIAKHLGVSPRMVYKYAKATNAERRKPLKTGPKKGESETSYKLTRGQRNAIAELSRTQGISQRKLAEMFGVTQVAVQHILKTHRKKSV